MTTVSHHKGGLYTWGDSDGAKSWGIDRFLSVKLCTGDGLVLSLPDAEHKAVNMVMHRAHLNGGKQPRARN